MRRGEVFHSCRSARVLADITEHGPSNVQQIASRLGLSTRDVSGTLSGLRRNGHIRALPREALPLTAVFTHYVSADYSPAVPRPQRPMPRTTGVRSIFDWRP